MPNPHDKLNSLLAEIRCRRSALTRAWDAQTLDRVARELSQRFFFEEALVRALIRDELSERGVVVSTQKQARTRSDQEVRALIRDELSEPGVVVSTQKQARTRSDLEARQNAVDEGEQ